MSDQTSDSKMEIEEEKGMNLQESTEDMEDGSNETIQTNKRQKNRS